MLNDYQPTEEPHDGWTVEPVGLANTVYRGREEALHRHRWPALSDRSLSSQQHLAGSRILSARYLHVTSHQTQYNHSTPEQYEDNTWHGTVRPHSSPNNLHSPAEPTSHRHCLQGIFVLLDAKLGCLSLPLYADSMPVVSLFVTLFFVSLLSKVFPKSSGVFRI